MLQVQILEREVKYMYIPNVNDSTPDRSCVTNFENIFDNTLNASGPAISTTTL